MDGDASEDPEGRLDRRRREQPGAQVVPHAPTQAQIDKHNIDHATFEPWCGACVDAYGREAPHRATDPETRTENVMMLDYNFYGEGADRPEREADAQLKVVAAVDRDSKHPFAAPTQTKGLRDRFAIVSLARWLVTLSQPSLTLHSDGEPPIKAFVEAVAREGRERHGLVLNVRQGPRYSHVRLLEVAGQVRGLQPGAAQQGREERRDELRDCHGRAVHGCALRAGRGRDGARPAPSSSGG